MTLAETCERVSGRIKEGWHIDLSMQSDGVAVTLFAPGGWWINNWSDDMTLEEKIDEAIKMSNEIEMDE